MEIFKEYLLSIKRNNINKYGQLIVKKTSSSYENSNKYKILVMTNSTLNMNLSPIIKKLWFLVRIMI